MPNIKIEVRNPAETEKFTMAVPNDVPVGDLRDAIVDSMGLPLRGQGGRSLRYHLSVRDRDGNLEQLNENDSLEENEVQEEDELQLTVEMTAGSLLCRNTWEFIR